MNSAYMKLLEVWNNCPAKGSVALLDIFLLLNEYGIKLRQNDDSLKQVTLSVPTTIENSFVLGMRYMKNDGTFTEDHFLCESEGVGLEKKEISHHPKRKLEHKLPEYRGTHKETPNIGALRKPDFVTDVNTYSYYGDFEKNSKSS
ncbi:MAG: hypothetical protein KZQ92_14565 [Candidatus Thiodiazotropha sp. (ex Lucinoma borealis)]|nr:hypothetical protein [Candidatus Thiodiazotropha sp. (ex Lucinoma borealis)]MCU7865191.1 hypothetical protein [Candidatus Thiodiazotropha sp. (ex Lucinoma borealis)]